jgi:hypothetical protein
MTFHCDGPCVQYDSIIYVEDMDAVNTVAKENAE